MDESGKWIDGFYAIEMTCQMVRVTVK